MATISWISTTGGDWSSGGNWQGGVVPGPVDDAVMNLTDIETITVSSGQQVHSVSFNDPAAHYVITTGGTLVAGASLALTGADATIGGVIAAGGDVAITMSGTIAFGASASINAAAIWLTTGSSQFPDPPAVPITGITTEGSGSGGTAVGAVACFAAGTSIATPLGEIPVEALAVGGTVLLADGGVAPVTWIGHRHVDCRRHPAPHTVQPVRVRRGAFADNVPHRDLILSPDHAIFAGDSLIPVRRLINGRTILRETRPSVDYFHVELPAHGIILAEGLAVESYLETGGRAAFDNGAVVQLHPQFVSLIHEAHGYAPLCVIGPILDSVRRRLDERADALDAGNGQPNGRERLAG